MTSFTLGQEPHRMTVVLSRGADFVATLRRSDNVSWTVGTVIEIVVDDNEPWTATLNGSTAVWEVDEVAVLAVIASAPKKAKLYHELDGTRVLWAAGPVVTS